MCEYEADLSLHSFVIQHMVRWASLFRRVVYNITIFTFTTAHQ
jgi:hypothetical protein